MNEIVTAIVGTLAVIFPISLAVVLIDDMWWGKNRTERYRKAVDDWMRGYRKDYPNRFLFHALLTAVLLTGASVARAEDGQPDPAALQGFSNQWGAMQDAHRAENQAALNAIDVQRRAQPHAQVDTTPMTPLPNETIEQFKNRVLDETARRDSAAGKPTYRTEDGLASFHIEGRQVTREQYLKQEERDQRHMFEHIRASQDYTKKSRFGLKEGDEGYPTDEELAAQKAATDAFEQKVKQEAAERRARIEKMKPSTLISREVHDEKGGK